MMRLITYDSDKCYAQPAENVKRDLMGRKKRNENIMHLETVLHFLLSDLAELLAHRQCNADKTHGVAPRTTNQGT